MGIFFPDTLLSSSSRSSFTTSDSDVLLQQSIINVEHIEPMDEAALKEERNAIFQTLVESSVDIISEYIKEDKKNVAPPKVSRN